MTLATDISTAASTAATAIDSASTQLALLEGYRVTNGGKAFYDAGAEPLLKSLRDQWAGECKLQLDGLIRGG